MTESIQTIMIKAVIFDLGGVLIDLDLERCRKAFAEDVGYRKIDELLDAWHQKGFYSDLEEGKLSADEFRRKIIEGSVSAGHSVPTTESVSCAESVPSTESVPTTESVSAVSPDEVDHAMWALLTGIEPYKIDFLRELSGKYDLYLLSNNNGISMVRCRQIFKEAGLPMEKVFRKQYLSYEMKMLKPSPQIYRAVIDDIGLSPDEMLFIDDSVSNVAAAASLGIHAVQYVPGADLRAAVNAGLEGDGTC